MPLKEFLLHQTELEFKLFIILRLIIGFRKGLIMILVKVACLCSLAINFNKLKTPTQLNELGFLTLKPKV